MYALHTNEKPKRRTPLSIVCEQDSQERQFDTLVKLWVQDEIPYSTLLKNYPSYESSMLKKLLYFISEKLH